MSGNFPLLRYNFPEFTPYLNHHEAESCIKAMVEDEVKPGYEVIIQFFKKAVEAYAFNKGPLHRELFAKAKEQLHHLKKEGELSEKELAVFEASNKIFKASRDTLVVKNRFLFPEFKQYINKYPCACTMSGKNATSDIERLLQFLEKAVEIDAGACNDSFTSSLVEDVHSTLQELIEHEMLSKEQNKKFSHLSKSYKDSLFYKKAFLWDDLAYTLIGVKPMSMSYSLTYTPFDENDDATVFDSETFLFKRFFNSDKDEDVQANKEVLLIHKQKFIEAFNENKDLFYEWFGSAVTAKSLLKDFENAQDLLHPITGCPEATLEHFVSYKNKVALGILLGYGRESAFQYDRMLDIQHAINDEEDILPYDGFTSIQEELNFLQANMIKRPYEGHPQEELPVVANVVFGPKKGQEAEAILNKFDKAKEMLKTLFSQGRKNEEVIFDLLKNPIVMEDRKYSNI